MGEGRNVLLAFAAGASILTVGCVGMFWMMMWSPAISDDGPFHGTSVPSLPALPVAQRLELWDGFQLQVFDPLSTDRGSGNDTVRRAVKGP